MITRIGLKLSNNYMINTKSKNDIKIENSYCSKPLAQINTKNYFIPFLGNKNKPDKLQNILFDADPQFKTIYKNLQSETTKLGYEEITTPIAFRYLLNETKDFINKLNNGETDYKTANIPPLASLIIDDFSEEALEDKKLRG